MAHAATIDYGKRLPPSPSQGSGIASFLFIGIPLLLIALCLAAKFGYVWIGAGPRAGLIFALLLVLGVYVFAVLDAFRLAHHSAGQNRPLYLGHPEFEGFEVVQTVRTGQRGA